MKALFLALLSLLMPFLPRAAEPLRPKGSAEKLGYHPGDTAIIIPADIRKLPAYCFAGCQGLRSVRFAEGSQLAQIDDFAFAECTDLTECILPPDLKRLGDGTFRGCTSLRSISIPKGIWEIPREAFVYCPALDSISLPAGLVSIRPLAFLDCQRLRIDRLPPTVTKIGNNAFGRCYAIKEMSLPARCTELESYAFADCIALESVTLPAKTEMLGELMFSGCVRLRSITCPAIVPPIIECNSFLFEPDDEKAWRDCSVYVPAGRVAAYRRSPYWSRFSHLSEIPK